MTTLFNFLDKRDVDAFNEFLECLNDPSKSNLDFLARKYHVTPARISQWIHHFFLKEYKPKKEIAEFLRIWIETKRSHLDSAEESLKEKNGLILVIPDRRKSTERA